MTSTASPSSVSPVLGDTSGLPFSTTATTATVTPCARWAWGGPVLVAVIGCAASLGLWLHQRHSLQEQAQERFHLHAQRTSEQVRQRVHSLSDILHGLGNLFVLHPHLRRAEFERVAQRLEQEHLPPGVINIHFTRYVAGQQRAHFQERSRLNPHWSGEQPLDFAIHPSPSAASPAASPAADADAYVIEYAWPLAGNRPLLGLDIASQAPNLESMLRARSTRSISATEPFALFQGSFAHNAQTPLQAPPPALPGTATGQSADTAAHAGRGVILRLPLWDQTRFIGAVGVTIDLQQALDFLASRGYLSGMRWQAQDAGWRNPWIGQEEVAPPSASGHPSEPVVLMQSPDYDNQSINQAMQWQQELEVGGRRWLLQAQPTHDFLFPAEKSQPWVLLWGGLLITALFSGLAWLWGRDRQRAQAHQQQTQRAWENSEQRFFTLFNQAGVGVGQFQFLPPQQHQQHQQHSPGELAGMGLPILINQKFADILGYSQQALMQLPWQELTHPDDAHKESALIAGVLAQLEKQKEGEGHSPNQYHQYQYQLEKRYRHKNGQWVWVELVVSLLNAKEQGQSTWLVIAQDIEQRQQMQAQLLENEARLLSVLEHMPVGVSLVKQGQILYRNAQQVSICGYSSADDEHSVDTWWCLTIPDARLRQYVQQQWRSAYAQARQCQEGTIPRLGFVLTHKDGAQRNVEISGKRVIGGGHVVIIEDVTARQEAEKEIQRLAYFDGLTGLPNRRLLLDRLNQAMALSQRHSHWGAVLMLDVDHFKNINDTLGPEAGDRLLQAIAQRLGECAEEDGSLARLGGDEFALLLADLAAHNAQDAAMKAETMAEKLLLAMSQAFTLDPGQEQEQDIYVGASIGLCLFQGQEVPAETVLQHSDIAMYQAKSAGRNTLRFYDPQMQVAVTERTQLEADMRRGIEQGQFVLYFQPQVRQGRMVGAEALLRWQHPEKGFISPVQFIPLAEESGLILPLGQWVLEQACHTLARWAEMPVLQDLNVAVNVSPRQFSEANLVAQVLAALADSQAKPERLKLEITESMLLEDIEETIGKMRELRSHGVGFSLDDFGTGYSSLSYLKRLPLKELKIDQSFVRDVLSDPNDAAIARTIVALGNSLGLQVTAEGVETEDVRLFLEREGCLTWQGYLLTAPLPVEKFEALAHSHQFSAL